MNRDEILQSIGVASSEVLGVDAAAVIESARFKDDLDADSLDLVELVMALEERFDVTIPEEELEGIETVADAIDLVTVKFTATHT